MRRSRVTWRSVLSIVAVGLVSRATPACAHRDDYLDETFVYQTLKRNEFEVELWSEARWPRHEPVQGWYTGAFEYGISPRWTVDGASQFAQSAGSIRFGRARLETRYRFAEEGSWPADLAASAEYEYERPVGASEETEHTLTPRLVVSKDFVRDVNTTLNLDFPIALAEPHGASFGYALGVRYPAEAFVRAGVEAKGEPSRHSATLFPQVWFALPREMTIKLGTGIGLSSGSDRVVARVVFEAEF